MKVQLDYLKAKSCLKSEKYAEAKQTFRELIAKYSEMSELVFSFHLSIGYCLFKENKLTEALSLFEQLRAAHGDSSLVYFYMGLSLLQLRRYIDAVQSLIQAASLDSSQGKVSFLFFFYLGKAQYKIKLYERAILSLTEAIGKNTKLRQIYLTRGKCYLQTGNLHNAKDDFLQALVLQKTCPRTLYSLAMLEYIKYMRLGHSKDLDAAAHYADNLLFKSPSHLKSLLLIGLILVKNGSYQQAMKSFGLAISLNANNRKARIFRVNGSAFLHALKGEGNAEEILKELGKLMVECGQSESKGDDWLKTEQDKRSSLRMIYKIRG